MKNMYPCDREWKVYEKNTCKLIDSNWIIISVQKEEKMEENLE